MPTPQQVGKHNRPPGPAARARELTDHLGIDLPSDLTANGKLRFAMLASEVQRTYDNLTPADIEMVRKAALGRDEADFCKAQADAAKVAGDVKTYLAMSSAMRQQLRVMQSALECLGLTGSRRGVVSRSRANAAGVLAETKDAESGWASILN